MIPLATLHPYTLAFDAQVTALNDDGTVELDTTYFYATGGGQPHDTGTLERDGERFAVVEVKKRDGRIAHTLGKSGLAVGDRVRGVIDEDRRTMHRRMHTAAHVLCAVIEQAEGTLVTGNQIGIEKTRIDFDLSSCDRERVAAHIARANDIIRSRLPVRKYATTRQALLDDPSLVKLAKGFPEHVTDVHMVEIAGFDIQPCGGTHVDDLAEIGEIVLLDIASKGKNNRRVTFGIR